MLRHYTETQSLKKLDPEISDVNVKRSGFVIFLPLGIQAKPAVLPLSLSLLLPSLSLSSSVGGNHIAFSSLCRWQENFPNSNSFDVQQSPLSAGNTFSDPQWTPKTPDNATLYKYIY